MTERFYLCGPMSGIPGFNIPLFDEAAEKLRKTGLTIVSPAELDDPAVRADCLASPMGDHNAMHGTWADFLARDVKVIADGVEGLVLLPGWEQSRGARLEVFVALLCNKQFANYWPDDGIAFRVSPESVRKVLRMNLP